MPDDDFAQTMGALARTLRSQPDLQATLQSTVDQAAEYLDGRAEVRVTSRLVV